MKKTFVALALAAMIPVAAYAAMEGQGARGDRLQRMTEVLNLDDSQQEQMKKMFDEHKAMRKAMREQMRVRMDEILTPEQRAKRDELREQRGEHRSGHHGEHRGGHSNKRGGRHHQRGCDQQESS